MRAIAAFLTLALLADALAQPNDDGFVPGHIYITELQARGCGEEHPHFIREIDPRTGRSWLLTECGDGLHVPNGLAFTPDGKFLRVLNFNHETVLDFDSAGNGRIVYDASDSINQPVGQNAVAFDELGYCYIFNRGQSRILKFPPQGGGPSIFADRSDGLGSRAGLAFASNGDLFVAPLNTYLLTITPAGDVTVFDRFERGESANTLAFDDAGNLFVGTITNGPDDRIYRYDGGQAENRRLLAGGLEAWGGLMALTVAPEQRKLYVVDYYAVTTIDINDGTERVLYEFPSEPLAEGGYGIAVFIPPGRGDVNCDGSLDLADVEPFIVALLDAEKYKNKYPDCDIKRADITLDGSIDLLDVEPFITLLLN